MKRLLLMLCGLGFALMSTAQSPSSRAIKFTENLGQWEAAVKYKANVPAGSLFLQQKQLTWLFWDPHFFSRMHDHHDHGTAIATEEDHADMALNMHAFNIIFPGASDNCKVEATGVHPEKNNYFIGDDRSKWASNVRSYSKVMYRGLWEGVDMEVFEFANSMKYEYHLEAGVDASVIQMKYAGAESIRIEDGHLIVKTSVITYSEDKPLAWQYDTNGERIIVRCDFHLEDTTVTFSFPDGYNKKLPLIIDPKLIFSTYSGATSDNWGNSACYDDTGHLYSAGTTFMSGFPATPGAYQVVFKGRVPTSFSAHDYGTGIDCAILKYSPDGTNLLAATYLGGFESEMPFSLFVNYDGDLLVLGATSSGGQSGVKFPVTAGAYQTTYGGGSSMDPLGTFGGVTLFFGSDLFIAKLSGDLSALKACTFVGGSGNDGVLLQGEAITRNYGDQFRGDIITDSLNNVYVASNTKSLNYFGAMSTGFDLTYNGGPEDAVVFKLTPDLSSMSWGTYLGGASNDAAFSIQLDSANNVYVAGGTTSADFPVTAGAYDLTYGGAGDGWVSRLKNDGTSLLSSSYIGTPSYDQVYFIQLDADYNAYLLGQTRGAYPVFNANYFNNAGGQFIQELDSTLSTSIMSTVFGSGGFQPNISPTAFLVNECGNMFINGWGGSDNSAGDGYIGGTTNGMPITSNAFQDITDGSDFYLMVLERGSNSLLYGTYIGDLNPFASGDHVDGGTSRFDKKGIVYAAVCGGCGGSSGFPTYPNPGAWSNTNNSNFTIGGSTASNCNNAAYKFDLANLIAAFDVDTTGLCDQATAVFTNQSIGGTSFQWLLDGTVFSTSSVSATLTFTTPGTYHIQLIATDATTCVGKDTAEVVLDILFPNHAAISTSDTLICIGDTVQLDVSPNDANHIYEWTPNVNISNVNIANPEVWPTVDTDYIITVTDENNCVAKDTVHVGVGKLASSGTWAPESNCRGDLKAILTNDSEGLFQFTWNFGDGSPIITVTTPTVVHQYYGVGPYEATVIIDNGACIGYDTLTINLVPVKIPNLMTMNNDGVNDVFEINGVTDNWKVDVYNRWGQRVFSKENYHNEFDGLDLHDGIYYYLVTSPDGKECKGWVHLMR